MIPASRAFFVALIGAKETVMPKNQRRPVEGRSSVRLIFETFSHVKHQETPEN